MDKLARYLKDRHNRNYSLNGYYIDEIIYEIESSTYSELNVRFRNINRDFINITLIFNYYGYEIKGYHYSYQKEHKKTFDLFTNVTENSLEFIKELLTMENPEYEKYDKIMEWEK